MFPVRLERGNQISTEGEKSPIILLHRGQGEASTFSPLPCASFKIYDSSPLG